MCSIKHKMKRQRSQEVSTLVEKEEVVEIDDSCLSNVQKGTPLRRNFGRKNRVVRVPTMAAKQEVIEIDDSYPSPVRNGSPLRPIFCLKNREDIKKFEEEEECFILEFDPYKDSDAVLLTNAAVDCNNEADLSVVAERGQVACRDYPHPRHTCAIFLFEKTPHDKHCENCYCYVCDSSAPCRKWTGSSGHCHAFNNEGWNNEKRARRLFTKTAV